MRKFFFSMLAAVLITGLSLVTLVTAAAPDLAGDWIGQLDLGATKLQVIFHLTGQADGTYLGKLDVPAQGAKGIPASKVSNGDGIVRVEIAAINGVFEGRFNTDGTEIAGEWKQNGAVFPLTLRRIDSAPALKRPQEPKPPFPYLVEDVAYENKAAGIKLAGTLTTPKSGGPVPAVLLITGSGPQDRDETLLGHRPFLVLADYLTRRGFAVLRVDDRGVGGSSGNGLQATSADLADDVLAGLAFLKGRAEIDPRRIGLIGHSEGGLIAPIAAVRSNDVAFIILMAGPGVSGEEIIYRQGELIMRAGGASEAQIAAEGEQQRKLYSLFKTAPDDKALAAQLSESIRASLAVLTEEERRSIGDIDTFVQGQLNALLSPWFRFFLAYDPRPTLAKVTCPVLAVIGAKDLQVSPEQNLPVIEEALKAAKNKDYTVTSLPGLNHLFQTCATGSPTEYGAIEETIAPAALQLIGDWLSGRAKTGK